MHNQAQSAPRISHFNPELQILPFINSFFIQRCKWSMSKYKHGDSGSLGNMSLSIFLEALIKVLVAENISLVSRDIKRGHYFSSSRFQKVALGNYCSSHGNNGFIFSKACLVLEKKKFHSRILWGFSFC